jgi:4-amino-4-deoxy-L-arabinose transferase-like glycosyltransferase
MARRIASAFAAWIARNGALISIFAILAFVAAVRLRVAGVPLERDEGEYGYSGQLILQGIPPYKLVYNMKFPGTYYAFSAILALFGQTPWGIHVGLLLVNAATTLLLFFLAKKLFADSLGAAVAACAFAVLSVDRFIMGIFAHATHFVLLPAIAGFLVLAGAVQSKKLSRFAIAGALLGTAVLMKQHGIFLLALGIAWGICAEIQPLERASRDVRGIVLRNGMLIAGSALPLAVLSIVLTAQGVFPNFLFWTFQYAREYIAQVPLSGAWKEFTSAWTHITQANSAIWAIAGIGIGALWVFRWPSGLRVLLTGFLIASFLSVCPGFYFREHYFILMLPVAALFVGVAITSLAQLLGRFISVGLARALAVATFIAACGLYVWHEWEYLFSMPVRVLSRTEYGANPFVEAEDIASYIRARTNPNDRIAILGSEPEIYFYAKRRSATGYIYTYPLVETQIYAAQMQNDMMDEVEAAHPKYIVYVRISTSWLVRKPERILDWSGRYLETCYDLTGIADIHPPADTTMLWDADVTGYLPRSKNIVYTFRRKTSAPCSVVR